MSTLTPSTTVRVSTPASTSIVPKKLEIEAVATLVRPISPSAILVLVKLAGPLRFK
jgi:hypothetical protein